MAKKKNVFLERNELEQELEKLEAEYEQLNVLLDVANKEVNALKNFDKKLLTHIAYGVIFDDKEYKYKLVTLKFNEDKAIVEKIENLKNAEKQFQAQFLFIEKIKEMIKQGDEFIPVHKKPLKEKR